MPKKISNRFEINDDTVTIYREGWSCVAQCTYRKDYWKELTSHAWQMDDNHYPVNRSLGGGLHRYMMKK